MSNFSSRGPKWEQLKKQVWSRDNYTCQLQMGGCTQDQDLTVDHIIPKAAGGQDEEHNLLTACRTCNGKKGARTLVRQTYKNKYWFNE